METEEIIQHYIYDRKGDLYYCGECDLLMQKATDRYIVKCPNGHVLAMETVFQGEK